MPKYWGQISVAFLVASTSTYITLTSGSTLGQSIAIGALVYIAIRWTIAGINRTRYWRKIPGTKSRSCPNCTGYIYRISGDWILECKRCGWKAGWPGIRWLTHSVPSIQFRRTIAGPQFIVFVFISLLLISGMATTVTDSAIDGFQNQSLTVSGDPNNDSSENGDSGVSSEETERLVFQYVNEKRTQRPLAKLNWNDRAAKAARLHAQDMAANDYFSHTSLDGQTQQQRYSFCNGGENAAQTWIFKRVRMSDGSTAYHTSSKELAHGIVDQWMNSDPHRERGIYGEWWSSAGVGVAISDDNKVYAVMGLCST